jgi:hypothetical protein
VNDPRVSTLEARLARLESVMRQVLRLPIQRRALDALFAEADDNGVLIASKNGTSPPTFAWKTLEAGDGLTLTQTSQQARMDADSGPNPEIDYVTGPVGKGSTDHAIARWNGTGGNAIQNSGVVIDDNDNMTVPAGAKVYFRDLGIYIQSTADGELVIVADSKVTVGVPGDIELGDSTERDMFPQTDGRVNLGKAANNFHDLYCDGTNIYLYNLPTSDPSSAGAIYADAGTLKVSAG